MNLLKGTGLITACALIATAVYEFNGWRSGEEATAASTANAPSEDQCCPQDALVSQKDDATSPKDEQATLADESIDNQLVAQIFTAFSSSQSKRLGEELIDDLSELSSRGDAVTLELPGFSLSGRVHAYDAESTIKNISIDLDNSLGRVFVSIHDSGKLRGNILFNGESRAFIFSGNARDGWVAEESTVGNILCAPSDSIYPLTANSAFLSVNDSPRLPVSAQANFTQIALNSLPDSDYVIYIDFDGETIVHPWWNDGNPISAEPHPQAANTSWVTVVWERVAEDFAPFNINVTTDRVVYNSTPVSQRVICVVTPTDTAQPGAGGVAFLNTFGDNVPCWTFNLSEYACADTISHEVGHTLGLVHDGTLDAEGDTDDEYFEGHGSGETAWGSIMGAPFVGANENVTQWSIGEYDDAGNSPDSPNTQDDLVVITSNGFGYRSDDSVNTANASASGLNTIGALIQDDGVIETTGDIDFFRFSTIGGLFQILASPLDVNSAEGEDGSSTMGANLAVELILYDDLGAPLLSDNPTNTLSATLSTILDEGDYYISIQGVGRGDPAVNGFSDYASLGQYFLSGVLARGPLSVRGGDGLTTLVVDGDTTPSATDGTSLGLIAITSEDTLSSQFAFANEGAEEITITSIGFSGTQFSFDVLTPLIIGSGLSFDLTLLFSPEDVGIVKEEVTISYYETSDPGRIFTYEFTVQAVVTKTDNDDNYEENDNFFKAFSIPSETRLVNIAGDGRQSDNDWYSFNVVPGLNEVTITCDFVNAEGDINIALYDTRGYFLASSETTEDQEQIKFVVNPDGGTHFIRVYGANAQNTYDLYWEGLSPLIFTAGADDSYESNNAFNQTYNLTNIKGSMLSSIDGDGVQYDNDWYLLKLDPLEAEITVSLTNTGSAGLVYMDIYEGNFFKGTAATNGLFEQIVIQGNPGATYKLRVYGDNIGASYDLSYTGAIVPVISEVDDNYEENDNYFNPFDFRGQEGVSLFDFNFDGFQYDPDWYQVRSSAGENVIKVTVNNADPDLSVFIYNDQGYQRIAQTNVESGQIILARVDLSLSDAYVVFDGLDVGGVYDFTWESIFVPEGDDIYEENDILEDAFDLIVRENDALSRVSGLAQQSDDDWYEIRAESGDAAIRARVNFTHEEGDINFALHDSAGVLLTSSESTDDNEFIAVTIPTAVTDETYYLRVYGANAGNEYDMTWASVLNLDDDEYEENDFFEDAFVVSPVAFGRLSDINGLGIQADDDIYSLDIPAGANSLQVFLSFIDEEGDIDIAIYDENLNLQALSISVSDDELVQVSVNPAVNSRVFILVYFGNAGNEYDMEWTYTFSEGDDADLDQVGDAWENKHYGRLSAVNGASNYDGDKFPEWAEYALDTNPYVVDSGILKPYTEDGYFKVKFFRNTEAAASGYRYIVKESADLDFDSANVLPLYQVISYGDYEEVIYRSTHSVDDVGQCFFYLEVDKPE
ncbi:MAG TPA: hypothetical protein DCX06_02890 [Opitutae bacterium]|nr:hypothetical protein [Opitutae bacterium]